MTEPVIRRLEMERIENSVPKRVKSRLGTRRGSGSADFFGLQLRDEQAKNFTGVGFEKALHGIERVFTLSLGPDLW